MSTTMRDLGLFTGVSQSENFANLKRLIPVREMSPSAAPRPWPVGESIDLPQEFSFAGGSQSVEALLERTSTSALLVLRDGEIRFERYWAPGGQDVQWISMSVAKSFVSALVGILVDDGAIRSIDDPITQYIHVELGSAFDGVSIRDILLMSSGARWNEDYSDATSDARNLMLAMAGEGGDLDDFVRRMEREIPPGSACRYNSGDTQVLGLLVRTVTGQSLAEFMQKRLMEPLGFENAGYWMVDASGNEAAFAGLNLTARDFARIGELYRLGGTCGGTQVLSADWVKDSTRVTAPQCEFPPIPGAPPSGYGYQWWLTNLDAGEYSAIGVYNQFVYVDPARNTTIVKLSANQRYGLSESDSDNLEGPNLAFLGALAASF